MFAYYDNGPLKILGVLVTPIQNRFSTGVSNVVNYVKVTPIRGPLWEVGLSYGENVDSTREVILGMNAEKMTDMGRQIFELLTLEYMSR